MMSTWSLGLTQPPTFILEPLASMVRARPLRETITESFSEALEVSN